MTPDFIIVAGPNGAGKSSYSYLFAKRGTQIHDADKLKMEAHRKNQNIPLDSFGPYLKRKYEEFEWEHSLTNSSMLVESNLRTDYLIQRARYLKEKGYKISLIFVALESEEISKQRVKDREADGGHPVDMFNIAGNFEKSRKNFERYFLEFDDVAIITPDLQRSDEDGPFRPKLLLSIVNRRVHIRNYYHEQWANELVELIVNKLPA